MKVIRFLLQLIIVLSIILLSPPPNRYPADVVSVAIAKHLANNAKKGISEKHLQFGPAKDPIQQENSKTSKKINNVPEEKFYEANGDVLELKQYIFKEKHESSEEESSEEVSQKKSKYQPGFNPASLGFDEIGYKPYQAADPSYVVVQNEAHSRQSKPYNQYNHQQHRQTHHKKSEQCNCYKDLAADQSAISESSMSFEGDDHHHYTQFST